MLSDINLKDISFKSVGLATILVGAALVSFGLVTWLWNYFSAETVFAFPSVKFIGGLITCALGYIILELELIRKTR